MMDDLALVEGYPQISGVVDMQAPRPFEAHTDALGVRTRSDDEVVLELPLAAVVDEVDTRIDVLVGHLSIERDIAPPLARVVAEEVVRSTGHLALPVDLRSGVRAHQTCPQHGGTGERAPCFLLPPPAARGAAVQAKDCLIRGEPQRVTPAPAEETDIGLSLIRIGLKVEWQASKGGRDLGLRLRTRGTPR